MTDEPESAFIIFNRALRNLLQECRNEFVKLADFLLGLVIGKGESND